MLRCIAPFCLLLAISGCERIIELDPDWNNVDADIDGVSTEIHCLALEPSAISTRSNSTVSVFGLGFSTEGNFRLDPVDDGETLLIDEFVLDGQIAALTFAPGTIEPGLYRVIFTLGDDEEYLCRGNLLVSTLEPPSVTGVSPSFAWTGALNDGVLSDQSVEIAGEGFLITPTVRWVSVENPTLQYEAALVEFVDSQMLRTTCPSETRHMPPGQYHLFVINPNGLRAQWLDNGSPGIFEVTDVAPPRIDFIDPTRSPAASEVSLTIGGDHFQENPTISFGRAHDDPVEITAINDESSPSTLLRATIPANSLDRGPHPVFVINPDQRFDVYYSFEATSSSSGHLDHFELADQDLITPRWRHAVTSGADIYGQSYLYVAGGIDDIGEVSDDIEILEVDVFGQLKPSQMSEQFLSPETPREINTLNFPRNGLALARIGAFLYAIGGTENNPVTAVEPVDALSVVERAEILGYDHMPQLLAPDLQSGTGLPIGTWHYQVSSIGPWGESLPSKVVQLRNQGGEITLCWREVDGATGYNIYRNADAASVSGDLRLLDVNVSPRCYIDDGRGIHQPAPSRLRGHTIKGSGLDLGYYTYRVTAVVEGRETLAGNRLAILVDSLSVGRASLRWSPVPNATYNLYRTVSATDDLIGDEQTFLIAQGLETNEFVDDSSSVIDRERPAPDGISPLPVGSLGRWERLDGSPLRTPREGLSALPITVPSESVSTEDRTFIYAVGGRSNSGQDSLSSVERAEVLGDGSLGQWQLLPSLMNEPRSFFVLLTNQGQRESRVPLPQESPCEDFDDDGFSDFRCGEDCDDLNASVFPLAPEVCGDGIDQDCDGVDMPCDCPEPRDHDLDGFLNPECGGNDCHDSDPTIYPGSPEICGDGIDQDCNGFDLSCDCPDPEDQDGDGYSRQECGGSDCDDTDRTIYPEAREICDDGIDQDCDGRDALCPEFYFYPIPGGDEESIFLFACQGDDSFSEGGGNSGLSSAEAVRIIGPSGELGSWIIQPDAALSSGQATHGHGGFLYFDFLFVMTGVRRESRDEAPQPFNSPASRFVFDQFAPGHSILTDLQSTSAGFSVPRSYYGTVRTLNFTFVVGGNDGQGPISSIEWVY